MKTRFTIRLGALLLLAAMLLTLVPVMATAQDIPSEVILPDSTGTVQDTYPHKTIYHTESVDVSTAEALAAALLAKMPFIRITADITVDRTFYVPGDSLIYSDEVHTLLRDPAFGGDMFVIGESADGVGVFPDAPASLTVGNPASESSDLLIIDGNAENMTATVKGTVFFVCDGAVLELYGDLTVKNAEKHGNSKALNAAYGLSYPEQVGGAVAIITYGSAVVFGGHYYNNSVNAQDVNGEDTPSSRGAVFYNFSSLTVNGGLFEGNSAARGGAIYTYRPATVNGGRFIGNYAGVNGGAICVANSQYAQLNLVFAESDESLVFDGNTADGNGGAIYSSAQGVINVYAETSFINNQATSGGAVCTYGTFLAKDALFENNASATRGGAVYLSRSDEALVPRISNFANCTFTGNTSTDGGAVAFFAGEATFAEGAKAVFTNCSFTENHAVDTTEDGTGDSMQGGAFYISRRSAVTVSDSFFTGNTAPNEGGAIYLTAKATLSLYNVGFAENAATLAGEGGGGAISVHSAYLNANEVYFDQNTAGKNGGAIYVSYSSDQDVNAVIRMDDAHFYANTADNHGGAIYMTAREVDEENAQTVLTLRLSTFDSNASGAHGGALYLTSKNADAYLNGITFTGNTSGDANNGGAVYAREGKLEIDTATFTQNTATENGGAIYAYSGATLLLNKLTANSNTAGENGGFLYNSGSAVTLYASTISNNSSGKHGGAMSLHSKGVTKVYTTTFTQNDAPSNGGAIYVYPGASDTLVHSCTFTGNNADAYGGAILVSNASPLYLYNSTAKQNTAKNGGFLYITTTDSAATIVGLTVSGNSATSGNIIYGNTTKAKLYINKALYTDEQAATLDSTYWKSAIANKVTTTEISTTVPSFEGYTEKTTSPILPPEKAPVPVTDVFALGESSSGAKIDDVYGALPRLDNSSNFMSLNTTVFENINGKDVTVDTFVSHQDEAANNGTAGEGILLYQALLYKKAHPEEEVYIDISSFRFSVEAAVCINRDSRYFGYMRNLVGREYDAYGFVRLSYLLITAAKMGIHVTVIGQLDGYPISELDPNFEEYFTEKLNDPCDPAYVADGVIGDYMKFRLCRWTSYDNKDATDMMHTKLCAVSHYIDKDGVAHKDAVWTSSSNLDGINNTTANNGNNKMQTSSLVSDHAEIYRISHNYLALVADYCEQEDVYEFRALANQMATEQINLILAGRGTEIPAYEQIVYLGTDEDEVFELYFAPFGGAAAVWSEIYNPYCKYLRALYESEDYIIFTFNNANGGDFILGTQFEELLAEAFHKNADPRNKIYVNLEGFDKTPYADLIVGETVGYMSFGKYHYGNLHNKDMQFSYVKNGERQYVTLLNSMNFHGGAMSYQSNFLLAIKETSDAEDSVFFTLADKTTKGIVEHAYGDERSYLPASVTEDGYTYRACANCDEILITGVIHRPGEWITDAEASADSPAIQHRNCSVCGEMLEARSVSQTGADFSIRASEANGKRFSAEVLNAVSLPENKTPATFEALLLLPEGTAGRGGILFGNYSKETSEQVSFEIYEEGRVRLYVNTGSTVFDHVFETDVSSDKPVHVALTVNGKIAALYIDGVLSETAILQDKLPAFTENYKIGGDNRSGNIRYFKGTLYALSLYGDVRTAKEIAGDAILMSPYAENILYSSYFTTEAEGNDGFCAEEKNEGSIASGKVPHTFEAILQLDPSVSGRGGVIVGNYGSTDEPINLEIYENGKVRLFFIRDGVRADTMFETDIRSAALKHILLSVNGTEATLYIDGVLTEQKTLPFALPDSTERYVVGGDYRGGNTQYFKGTIYSVALYEEAIGAQEVASGARAKALLQKTFAKDQSLIGTFFTEDAASRPTVNVYETPHTFEAILLVPTTLSDRGGVIVGNYDDNTANRINLEIYSGGRVRLFFTSGSTKINCLFNTDIRSNAPRHIAVTVDGKTASLYVDGALVETQTLSHALPESTAGFRIGSDERQEGAQYFKGILYALALFEDVRCAAEIAKDALLINGEADGLLYLTYYKNKVGDTDGKTFTADEKVDLPLKENATPHTFEATVLAPLGLSERGGVIVGNYDRQSGAQVNIEIYEKGRVRLYFRTETAIVDHIFETDIRSDAPRHIAVTVNGTLTMLYVDGVLAEKAVLPLAFPEMDKPFYVGGDARYDNTQYFKGIIYSVALFDDVRTADEIRRDAIAVAEEADGILANVSFRSSLCQNDRHTEGVPVTLRPATETESGLYRVYCTVCGEVLLTGELCRGTYVDYASAKGKQFSDDQPLASLPLTDAPKTIEAWISLPSSYANRAGTLFGNYDGGDGDQINFEIYTNGAPRLYVKTGGTAFTYLFNADIRSKGMTHVAVTMQGTEAKLYVNGVLVETATLSLEIPDVSEGFIVGGDHRVANAQYFKGTVYAVTVFSDVRTADEIARDSIIVLSEEDNKIASVSYLAH